MKFADLTREYLFNLEKTEFYIDYGNMLEIITFGEATLRTDIELIGIDMTNNIVYFNKV